MKSDESLQHHPSILLRTFDKISDYVFFMEVDDASYRYQFVNLPGRRAIQLTDADLGKTLDDMLPSEVASTIAHHYDEAIRTRQSLVYEDYRIAETFYDEAVEPDDIPAIPLQYFESEVTPIFDASGQCTHIVSVVREVTERKRRELELSLLRDHHESLRRYSPHGIFVLDTQFTVKSMNPAAVTITGYDESSMLHHSFLRLFANEQQALIQRGLHIALDGTSDKYHACTTHRTGHALDLSVLTIPIEVNGRITGVFAILIDLTPEKNAERLMRASEQRYRQLIETIPEGIIVHQNGLILYANAMALETLGEATLEHKSIFAYIAEHDQAKTRERLATLQRGDAVVDSDVTVITSTGRVLDLDISSLLIDYEGVSAILTIVRDVTEKREMEQALRQSEMQYRLITENMSDLVCILEPDGQVRYASPSHETVLGYPAHVFETKNKLSYIHPEDVTEVKQTLADAIDHTVPLTLEFRQLHADGHWVWLEAKIQAICEQHGRLLHYLTVSREITQRKALESRLTHLAYHDTLTDLPNRRYFMLQLEEWMTDGNGQQDGLAVFALDVDRFKQINDTFGHDAGDELLRQLAERLTHALRKHDVIARLGGDEFAILVRTDDTVALRRVAEKVLATLQRPWEIHGHTFITTSSVGIARRKDGESSTSLLKRADLALYEAKASGRNQYIFA